MTMRFSSNMLVCLLLLLKMVDVIAQPGFISIDCGIASGYSYVDPVTTISYVSDNQYIDTGTTSNIDANHNISSLPLQLSKLRSFPTGDRNCYTLPVVQYQRYLVRARFMYGNYDGKNRATASNPLQFDLHLGTNFWKTMNITDADSIHNPEALTFTNNTFLFICLINTGKGEPFVSALELRPLKYTLYNLSQSNLALVERVDTGASANDFIRYPTDPHDRFWRPYTLDTWITISTDLNIFPEENGFEAPSNVLRTASTPAKGLSMDFVFDSDSVVDQFYIVFYFADVQVQAGNASRQFDIYRNGHLWFGNYSVHYLTSAFIADVTPFSGATSYKYSLKATGNSTLPPLINGLEIYSVMLAIGAPTDVEDVDAMKAIKKQYQVKRNWMGDPCSPSKYIWSGLKCANINGSSRITSLNLSSSGLSGVISSSFAKLIELKFLDLSSNSLTGEIPDILGNMSSLQFLILSCNNLTGSVPASLLRRSNEGKLVIERFDDDTNSCQKYTASNSLSSSKSKISKPIVVVVSVVPAMLLLYVIYIIYKGRKLPASASSPSVPSRHEDYNKPKLGHADHQIHVEMKKFSRKQLANITRNFERVIGKGGFGTVYHGYLPDGRQVAVKILSQTSKQGIKEFFAEAQNLARIHHRNLVSLVGYCMDGDYLSLVYEYMAQGSLREHLRGNTDHLRLLSWGERLRIAVDAAQGLEYLHSGCKPPIIHRDIKSSNILLSEKMEAKIADFGLSRALHSDDQTHISTALVVGTPGYVDPEYHNTLQVKEKSDVYSFGVVLLEMITGQPPIIQGALNIHIVQHVASNLSRGELDGIIDERLQGKYDSKSMRMVLDLALQCTKQTNRHRPTMSEVVTVLKESLELETTCENSENISDEIHLIGHDPSTV